MPIKTLERYSSNLGRFTAAVSRDADELIGRTVLEATGHNFQDYVAKGGVPPLSLFFKAYSTSAAHHLKRALNEPGKCGKAEILNPQDEIIGYTHYDRVL